MSQTVFSLSFSHQKVLSVGRHVQPQGEGEVRVDLLLHHGHHVKGVAHGVEAQDPWQLLETGSVGMKQDKRVSGDEQSVNCSINYQQQILEL